MFLFTHRTPLVLVCALLFSACTSMATTPAAKTDYSQTFDFSQVKNIAIQAIDRTVLSTAPRGRIRVS